MFIAHGYWYDDPALDVSDQEEELYWAAPHYSLTRVDIHSGDAKTLRTDIHADTMHLLIDEQYLYSVWQASGLGAYLDDLDYCHFCVMDFDANVISEHTFYLDEVAVDYLIYQGKLFLITSYGIYTSQYPYDTLDQIYVSPTEIENEMEYEHCCIEENSLYFREENLIKAIDIDSYAVSTVFTANIIPEEAFLDRHFFGARYQYIVMDHHLYYFDYTLKNMRIVDLDFPMDQIVLDSEYYFKEVNEAGLLVFIGEKDQYRLVYYPNRTGRKKSEPFNFTAEKGTTLDEYSIIVSDKKYVIAHDYQLFELNDPVKTPDAALHNLN